MLGRRIGSLPALLILTFRAGEAPLGHRLHATVGAIPASSTEVIELAPLSERAVTTLAGDDAVKVYAATGGNPFYVSELLASPSTAKLPPSVANAVLGRASRLDDDARRLVELVSVVPGRIKTSLLDAVMPDWAEAAEEPERRQLLEVDPAYVHFRHELARHAVRSSLPIAARRRLHADMLDVLLAAHADPADIVHHAEAAGNQEVVAEYVLVVARGAAALESRREAYSHYRRAVAFVDRRPLDEQAAVLEELATAAYLVNFIDEAFHNIERAIDIYRDLGHDEAVGRCLRLLSRLHWFAGNGGPAESTALESIAILEALGESVELARAYSGLSQLAMLAQDIDQALLWGNRALELATRLGDDSTVLTPSSIWVRRRYNSIRTESSVLVEAHAIADAAGDRYEAARALNNLGYTMLHWVQPDLAMQYAQQTKAYSDKHEVHNLSSYSAVVIAWLQLRAGEWDEAERVTQGEIDKGITVTQLLAKTVLAELAVRRGDADAADRLADVAAQADRTDELQRITPVLELATEYALTRGFADADRNVRQDRHRVRPSRSPHRMECASSCRLGCHRRDRHAHRRRHLVLPYSAVVAARLAGGCRCVRRRGLDVRPGVDVVDARRRGAARRSAGDRPATRCRAVDKACDATDARARVPGPSGSARVDSRQPGRAHRSTTRGAGSGGRGPHQRRDRRTVGRFPTHRGAPSGCCSHKARRQDPTRSGSPSIRAGLGELRHWPRQPDPRLSATDQVGAAARQSTSTSMTTGTPLVITS